MVDIHLVVLVHGLWGNSGHMDYIQSQLEKQNENKEPHEELKIHKTGSHSGNLTYDGIDVNGKRISDEIIEIIEDLTSNGDVIKKFSIVSYSLGGLISRYAIGILYSHHYFDKIEPVNFITFCSPHVGVLTPGKSFSVSMFNRFVPYFFAHTGSQLFLKDTKSIKSHDNKNNLPLLLWMTDPSSFFFKALAKFKHRSLYANVMNDKRTSWFTSSISLNDPFESAFNEDTKAFHFEYIKNYDPVVIDYSKPIQKNFHKMENSTENKFFYSIGSKAFNSLILLGRIMLLTPLWFIWFASNSIIERIKLNRRVSAFFRDTSNNLLHLYDIINEDINSGTDDYISRDESLKSDEELSEFSSSKGNETLFTTLERDLTDQTDIVVESVFSALNDSSDNLLEDTKSDLRYGASFLHLSDDQTHIIMQLNSLQWNKYPIVIRKTKASHACAIVRSSDENFAEGKIVIQHFVQEVFQYTS